MDGRATKQLTVAPTDIHSKGSGGQCARREGLELNVRLLWAAWPGGRKKRLANTTTLCQDRRGRGVGGGEGKAASGASM